MSMFLVLLVKVVGGRAISHQDQHIVQSLGAELCPEG